MSRRNEYDLICIGSGPAGQRAAIQAAKLGKRAAVVEQQSNVGGVCIATGTIPSKTFLEAVRQSSVRRGFEPDGSYGASRRAHPTMPQLIGHVGRVIQREVEIIQDALTRNDVSLINGRATFTGPQTLTVESWEGQRTLTAANILIAVGTRPSHPRGVEPDGHTVLTPDNILELEELPRTMAVVGAGVIGLEYASMFAALGVQVTVIDQRPRPLEFLDHEIVDELMHQMRKSDVMFRCGEAVEQVSVVHTTKPQGLLQLQSGKYIVSDVILFAAGRVGATDTLHLEAAGLKADTRGRLSVDSTYRTSVKSLWAAGDVIGYPSLAATSSEQGRLAACHMFGRAAEPMCEHYPVGIYTIPEISMVGATEEMLTQERVPYEAGIARYKEISRGSIMGDDSGMFKMLFHREDGRLLGCHCIGSGATELIHIGQAVIGLGGGIDYFLRTVFNYPTLAECYKVAAHNAANKISLIRHVTNIVAFPLDDDEPSIIDSVDSVDTALASEV